MQQALTTASETLEKPVDQQGSRREQPVRDAEGTEPLVLTAPRELEYVFEVSAEEASMQDLVDSGEVADDFLLEEDDLAPLDTVEDETFAYEVRTGKQTSGQFADAGKNASSKMNTRKRSRAHKEK